jgi:hypothetical protein
VTGKITTVRGAAGGSHPVIKPGVSLAPLAYTGTSAQSAAHIGSRIVRLVSTADCFVAVGANPTASNTGVFLPASKPEFFVCDVTDKVAAIQVPSGSTLYITPAA